MIQNITSSLLFLILTGFLIGYVLIVFYEIGFRIIHKKTQKKPILRIKGLHFHHSLYGIILIVIIHNPFTIGTSLGIIVRHTVSEKKFTFIDRT